MWRFAWFSLLLATTCAAASSDSSALQTLLKRLQTQNKILTELAHQEGSRKGLTSAQLKDEIRAVIRLRSSDLKELIRLNPGQAIENRLGDADRAALTANFPELHEQLESSFSYEGPINVVVYDDFANRESHTEIHIQPPGADAILRVYWDRSAPDGLTTGATVRLKAIRLGDSAAADTLEVTQPAASLNTCSSIGPQKTAVLLTVRPGSPIPDSTPGHIKDLVFGQQMPSVNGFYKEMSRGKAWLEGDVFGYFMLDQDYTSDGTMYDAVIRVAENSGVDFRRYNRIVIMYPYPQPVNSHASLGCFELTSRAGVIPESTVYISTPLPDDEIVYTIAHEMGHNLGLQHSNLLTFPNEPLGPPSVPGSALEYGDFFSNMGSGRFNHWPVSMKGYLNWVERGADYQDVLSTGEYSLSPSNTSATGVKALRVARPGTSHWLWIEYRAREGYERYWNDKYYLWEAEFSGALIHLEDNKSLNAHFATYILDFDKTYADNFLDAPLAVGRSWSDPYSLLSISVLSLNGDEMRVRVELPAAGQSNSLKASVTHTSDFVQGLIGEYTITVSNENSTVPNSSAIVTYTLPSGLYLRTIYGTGWTCPSPGTVCGRTNSSEGGLKPGTSYPPINIQVDIAADAAEQVVNKVSVAAGGFATTVAADPTTIVRWTSGSGPTEVGMVANNGPYLRWEFDTNASGAYELNKDKVGFFGTAGDIPVVGDWTGEGAIRIGVFRPSEGRWYLDWNNDLMWESSGDAAISFGLPGDIPVVGDWNGDGRTKIGVVRCNSACIWILDYTGLYGYDSTKAKVFVYGQKGDLPVVSNWNGTGGADQIGVFRNGTWIVDSNGDGTWQPSDARYSFGMGGDIPIVGNWMNGARRRIGVFRAGTWIVDANGSNAYDSGDTSFTFGEYYAFGGYHYTPVTGHWTMWP